MRPSSPYFIVQIDHTLQKEKRENLPTTSRAYLGMKFMKIEGKKGLIVHSVDKNSPAEKAGFMINDVITAVDEVEIETPEQLIEYLWRLQPGKVISLAYISALTVTQNGSFQVKTVKLAGKKSTFELPEEFRDMAYNLQFGTIVAIGKVAAKEMPYARIGDILIFDHKVEYKARTAGDELYNDYHLVGFEGKDELRLVDHDFEVFGVLKLEDGIIIPHQKHVFCHQNFKKSEFQMQNGIWIPDGWDQTIDELQAKIDALQEKIQDLAQSGVLQKKTTKHNFKKKEELFKLIDSIRKEKESITRTMNQARYMELTVLFFNPSTADLIGGDSLEPGDKILVDYRTLYPLDISGVYYTLVRPELIFAKINNNMEEKEFKLIPFSDYVIIEPDEAPKMTQAGLHIPDTVNEKPTQGRVIAVGKGKKDEEMEAVVGEKVLYSKHIGTEIRWADKIYLIMRQSQILTHIAD